MITSNMKVLVVLPALIASISGAPEADAYYGNYDYRNIGPAALGYPYAYAQGNSAFRAPLRVAAPIPVARSYQAVRASQYAPAVKVFLKAVSVPAVATVKAVTPLVKAVPAGVVFTQFHAQDELGKERREWGRL